MRKSIVGLVASVAFVGAGCSDRNKPVGNNTAEKTNEQNPFKELMKEYMKEVEHTKKVADKQEEVLKQRVLDGKWVVVKEDQAREPPVPPQVKKMRDEQVKNGAMTLTFFEGQLTRRIDQLVLPSDRVYFPAGQEPPAIDVTTVKPDGKESTMLGIFKRDGDDLTIYLAVSGDRPKEIRGEAAVGHILIQAKRKAK